MIKYAGTQCLEWKKNCSCDSTKKVIHPNASLPFFRSCQRPRDPTMLGPVRSSTRGRFRGHTQSNDKWPPPKVCSQSFAPLTSPQAAKAARNKK